MGGEALGDHVVLRDLDFTVAAGSTSA